MRSLWAVAVNTIRQAVRMKIVVIFIVLLLVLLAAMSLVMTGDGTLKGRVQAFVSYGLSLTTFLLCLLTIVVSTYSLTNDIKQKQIYTVLTKPLRRCRLIIGKLLGVILLDVVLLVVFSGVVYVIAISIPKLYEADESELVRLNNEFFTARASLVPEEPDVTGQVQEAYKKLEDQGTLPKNITRHEVIEKLSENYRSWQRAAVPGHEIVWNFHGVKAVGPNQSLFVRFKYDVSLNPPDLQVFGKWFVGDDRQIKMETPVYKIERKDLVRTFQEIEVPADAVADDEYVAVGFLNDPRLNNAVVIFPPKDGLEVLYKADTFTANFIRAVLLILFQLIFLACLGLLASTFLSFPVAVLVCFVVFFTGTISCFCLDSFDSLSENLSRVYYYTLKPAIQILPQFDKFSPTKFLVPARLLSWTLVAKVAGLRVFVKSFLLLLLSLLIFSRREIAKIII